MTNKVDKDTIERVLVMTDNLDILTRDCNYCSYYDNWSGIRQYCCSENDRCTEGIARFLYDMQEDED